MRASLWGMGSSPLARGPHILRYRRLSERGLIPARAGTTLAASPLMFRGWAHPRSRGDHASDATVGDHAVGSSPLARGPPGTDSLRDGEAGLIPARAGTTRQNGGQGRHRGAHPRSRGDHPADLPRHIPNAGSSPLARGPQPGHIVEAWETGLIPARAGTTSHFLVEDFTPGAHPRSRGDHFTIENV